MGACCNKNKRGVKTSRDAQTEDDGAVARGESIGRLSEFSSGLDPQVPPTNLTRREERDVLVLGGEEWAEEKIAKMGSGRGERENSESVEGTNPRRVLGVQRHAEVEMLGCGGLDMTGGDRMEHEGEMLEVSNDKLNNAFRGLDVVCTVRVEEGQDGATHLEQEDPLQKKESPDRTRAVESPDRTRAVETVKTTSYGQLGNLTEVVLPSHTAAGDFPSSATFEQRDGLIDLSSPASSADCAEENPLRIPPPPQPVRHRRRRPDSRATDNTSAASLPVTSSFPWQVLPSECSFGADHRDDGNGENASYSSMDDSFFYSAGSSSGSSTLSMDSKGRQLSTVSTEAFSDTHLSDLPRRSGKPG